MSTWNLPVRPYSPIDALNRRAAALGSPRYGELTAHADYNGHHIKVEWNSYRGHYVAYYMWSGPVWLARGSFADCLAAALREYGKGALGAGAEIIPREDDLEAEELCRSTPELKHGSPWVDGPSGTKKLDCGDWWTWRHDAACDAARDSANPRIPVLLFDWPLMQAASNLNEYEAALKAKHGRAWI